MQNFSLNNFTVGRNNNLDALRLIGAFLVLFSHSFAIVGLKEPGVPFYQATYGTLGVAIFFIISGFLITQSFLRINNPARYLWSRFLRIFPGIICVIFISVFILGALITRLPKNEYFSNNQTYMYLRMMTLYDTRYALPGVFTNNPISNVVNGSLWTLEYEFSFYLIVLLLGITRILKRRQIVFGLFILSLILTYFNIGTTIKIYTLNIFYFEMFFIYFGFGMVAYLYRETIPLKISFAAFCVFLLTIASFKNGFNNIIFVFIVGYLVLFIGYWPKIKISWLTKFGDFSYGIYIYAYPVQQTVTYFYGGKMNVWLNILIASAVTIILAALSWFLIEKKMLSLKNIKFPNFLNKKNCLSMIKTP